MFLRCKNACQGAADLPHEPPERRPRMTDDTPDETTPPTARAKRGGRPRLAPDEQRGETLPPVRVTAAERAFVEANAARAGLPLSEFCRRAVLRRRIAPAHTDTDAAALLALNRIGVLLNQIARRANASGRVSPHLDAVLDQVGAAIERLARPHDGS